jgi:glycosyltransferase involved in cell wall biosynthesis
MGGQASANYEKKDNESLLRTTLTRRSLSTLVTGFQTKVLQSSAQLVTPISINSLNLNEQIFADYDLLHIHAFYNLLSVEKITELSRKLPVVLTMHDQRFFTGGCHYSFECIGYKSSCQKCPQVRFPFKSLPELSLHKSRSLGKNPSNLTLLTPSEWLANCARQSVLLQNQIIHVIPNPIPKTYKPLPEYKSKAGGLKIGFFAHDLNNPYKGLETLLSAVQILRETLSIEVKLYGRGVLKSSMQDISFSQSYFNDDDSAVKAYNSCDVVVVPSIQDNSPSVVAEALMCGVPVIGTKVGGISEILDEFKLPTFEPKNPSSLVRALQVFVHNNLNFEITNMASQVFSYKSSSDGHRKIYENSLANFKI